MHSLIDYIDRIIPTNGFIANDFDTDMQYYTGYRIFIRDHLDDYKSVQDWMDDTVGFRDRDIYGYGYVTEYVYQEFSRESSIIIDAGLRNWNMKSYLSSVSQEIDNEHLITYVSYNSSWIKEAVNLHRKRNKLPLIEYDDEIEFDKLIDTTSKTALLEQKRYLINQEETQS